MVASTEQIFNENLHFLYGKGICWRKNDTFKSKGESNNWLQQFCKKHHVLMNLSPLADISYWERSALSHLIRVLLNILSQHHLINAGPKVVPMNPANNYMFKVNNKNTRSRCEICSKLTIKTPERRHENDVNGFVLVFLLLTLNIFHTLLQCFYY